MKIHLLECACISRVLIRSAIKVPSRNGAILGKSKNEILYMEIVERMGKRNHS